MKIVHIKSDTHPIAISVWSYFHILFLYQVISSYSSQYHDEHIYLSFSSQKIHIHAYKLTGRHTHTDIRISRAIKLELLAVCALKYTSFAGLSTQYESICYASMSLSISIRDMHIYILRHIYFSLCRRPVSSSSFLHDKAFILQKIYECHENGFYGYCIVVSWTAFSSVSFFCLHKTLMYKFFLQIAILQNIWYTFHIKHLVESLQNFPFIF